MLRLVAVTMVVVMTQSDLQYQVIEQWQDGFKLDFTLTPDHDIHTWEMTLHLPGEVSTVQVTLHLSIQVSI